MEQTFTHGSEPIPGYHLRRCLGRGGSGEVWESEAPGGVAKAMKIALIEDFDFDLARREFEGLQKVRSVRHPFLLAIDRFEVVGNRLLIVMELADRSLSDRFDECVTQGARGIPRPELIRYLIEAAEVLDTLGAEHGLQHLDIKPTNLLLSSGHVKVADFGLVQPHATGVSTRSLAFSPGYAPLELLEGTIHRTADQYGLAVTYQEMLTGTMPFRASSLVELACEQQDENPNVSQLPIDDQIIVRRALHLDPERRFENCTKLVEALTDPIEYLKTASASQLHRPVPRGRRARAGASSSAKTRPMPRNLATDGRKTVTVNDSRTRNIEAPESLCLATSLDGDGGDQVRATFLAALPSAMYAIKLRAFIDAMDAEVTHCTEQSTVLLLRPRRGWMFRRRRGIYLKLDTFSRTERANCSVVDVTIWSDIPRIRGEALNDRALLLIRCLKTYFMANDSNTQYSFEPAVVRGQLWSDG